MQDLTKIEKPFGLLDAETQAALKAWPYGVEQYVGNWALANPMWRKTSVYRARPAPLTPDSINWDQIAPEYVAMARDKLDVLLYTIKPIPGSFYWTANGGKTVNATAFASYVRGNVDWRDSLVMRP